MAKNNTKFCIRAEVRQIVADELQHIQSDPELQYLLSGR